MRGRLPSIASPFIVDPLGSRTWYLETKVRLLPGLYLAARGDQLKFSTVHGSTGPDTWDADVSRVELGVGYTVRRGLLIKASVMNNWRDGGAVRESPLAALQASFWF